MDAKGRRVSVVLPVGEYEGLLEDLHDLAVVAERRNEPAAPHAAVKKNISHVRHRREACR